MSWRTVIINNRAKLDFKMNYLVVRGENTTKIHIKEISVLIVQTTAVSVTAALLSELVKNKVKVIFCDEKNNPSSELTPYYGMHKTSLMVRQQVLWKNEMKERVWTKIVHSKIKKQMELLCLLGKEEATLLKKYLNELEYGDTTNREGHAAKVYFNALFGKSFTRDSNTPINAALNYGYAIVLSAFNREVVSAGYITQLGLFHDNQFNQYNLSCDLMESFRPIVDKKVLRMKAESLAKEEKTELASLLDQEVMIGEKKQRLENAIGVYSRSVFEALETEDISRIKDYEDEL
ncbi:MAG: type II CRISPR-associated endonuclease Cas1 [Eubacteriaceae bacterium]|jgi:CRISPR-associated protein Cas1|nr:type II CRISPR-associated endonuclease Cas1 [Eubacteriaceae bacterium]